MNELKIFEHPDFGKIRTVTIDDEPYLVGRDVADVLGYQNGSRDINRHVDEDDRRKTFKIGDQVRITAEEVHRFENNE